MMNLSNYAGIERPEMIKNIRHINGEKIEVTYKDQITMLYATMNCIESENNVIFL